MKYISLVILSFLFVFVSCNKEQEQIKLLEVEEIKTRISNEIKQTKEAFDWKSADNLMIYSTLLHRDSIALIGYIPEGKTEDDFKFNKMNIREDEWVVAKIALQDKIINAANQLGNYDESYLIPPEPEDRRLPYFYAKIFDLDLIDELRKDPRVRYIEPPSGGFFVLNPIFNAGCGPDGAVRHCDRIFVGNNGDYYSWHFAHEAHRINQAWQASQNKGAGKKVAVFDTGLSQNFIDNYFSGESGGRILGLNNNFAFNNSPLNGGDYLDRCSHGTNISGIIAGPKTNNGGPFGIAYKANLYMYRSLDDVLIGTDDLGDILSAGITGIGWNSDDEIEGVKRSLMDAVDNGINVINMSIGSHFISNLVDDALRAAHDADIIMFAAAGTYQANAVADLIQNSLPVVYPANSDFTLGVTGLRESGQTCYECGDGPEVDFVVHMQKGDGGRAVTYGIGDTQDDNGNYSDEDGFLDDNFGGSSAATATMSGIATLLWSEYPDWTREQVVNQLIMSGSNYPNKSNSHGWGTVNAYEALTENLANPNPPNQLLIDKITMPNLPDEVLDFDDDWMVTINGEPIFLHRINDGASGVPSMFAFDENDCGNLIWDLPNTNTLDIEIWVEGNTSKDCKFNDETFTEPDYDRHTETITLNANSNEGSFPVNYNSTEHPGVEYSFEFHYTRYNNQSVPDAHPYQPIASDYCEGPAVLFYEENNAVDFRYIASAMPGTDVFFNFSGIYTDLNDVTRSIKLRNVEEGSVFVLYDDDSSAATSQLFEIHEADWVEIRAKRFIAEKTIGTLENSFEDDDVRVIFHRNNNLDGKVSLYQSLDKPIGPTIDFYDDENAEGSLQCSIEIQDGSSVDFTEYTVCDNDEAKSAVLYDIPAGMTISLFDRTEDDNPFNDDWIQIYAKNSFKEITINTFEVVNGENPYEDDNIIINYNIQDGKLNDKVSWVKVDVNCVETPLQVQINQTQTLDCFEFSFAALEANITGGTPPFIYEWTKVSTNSVVGDESSISNLSSGEYIVKVEGSRGCPAVFERFTVEFSGIGDLDETITNASCGESDGRISLTPEGNSPYSYQWSHQANNPTSSATNLSIGSYTVTVTDAAGCAKVETFEIEEDINFRASVRGKNTTSCNVNDGWAEVRLTGLEGEPLISWSTGASTARIEGLAPGTYTVDVLDQESNCSIQKSITIRQPSVNITGGGRRVYPPGTIPSATLTASISCSTCTYIWSTGEMGRRITVSESGTYSVTADDGNGCIYRDSQSVTFVEIPPNEGGNPDDGNTPPGNCETCPGGGGDGNCSFWQNIIKTLLGLNGCPPEWRFPVLHAFDPNDIAGNIGYEEDRWVSVNERLGYVIRFENDPEFATGPAQTVTIRHPLDPNINPYTLRLSDFGFGSFNFSVPPNSITYNGRLDVTDSLGVLVDVIAGIDVQNNEAFWILKSIDPTTGQTPIDASLGFLEVTDTTITRFNDSIPKPSEGFVSFSIMPDNQSITGDTVMAQASIIFDQNAPIETNIWKNTIDAFPPISTMNPATYDGGLATLTWTGQDDPGGVGIQNYSIYYSVNGGEFELLASDITGNTYIFEGVPGNTYEFFTIAKDHVNNTEALKTKGEIALIFNGRIDFDIKVLLEGAYNSTTSEMTTILNTSRGLLPGQTPASNLATPTPAGQPYNRPPWDYEGTEGANWTSADYPAEAVDWVLVSFRTGIQKNTEIGITAALLLKDGTVEIPETFTLPGGTNASYIVVEHRNHVGAMTPEAIDIEGNTLTHDFTLAESYDGNGTGSGQKQLPTGEWVMFAGDADQSDLPSYDILGSDKIPWEEDNGNFDYYTSPDFNMDGDVNGADKAIWFQNNGISSRVPK